MTTIVTKVALAVALAAGTAMGSVAPVSAQTLELEIGPDGVRPLVREDHYETRRDRRSAGGCSERQALRAARSEGLRNVEIVRATRRSITVEGDTRDGVETIRFANAPGCPEI